MAVRISSDASSLKRSANVPPSTGFTIAGWFYFNAVTPARFWGTMALYAGADGSPTSSTAWHAITSAASGSALLQLGSGAGTPVDLITAVAGRWYFLALTGSGTGAGTVSAYARAAHEKAFTKATNATTFASFTAARVEWGREAFTADFMDGALETAVAFDRVLDDAELMKLSVALAAEKPLPDRRGLNVFYRLRGNHDTQDLSGNARPFTATVGANAQGYKVNTRHLRVAPAPAGSDVTVALTGVSATGGVGTMAVDHAQSLTGNGATGSVGTLTPASSTALSGVSASGQVGSLGVIEDGSAALSGNAAVASVGTLAPSTSVAVTGNGATGTVGTLAPSNATALTGNAAATSVGSMAPTRAVGLSGVSAAGQVGNLGAGGDVTTALTGNAATGSVGTLAPGSAAPLTGNAATSAVGTLGVNHGQALTGSGATSSVGSVVPSTALALSGVAAAGQVGSLGAAAPGQASLSGVAATGQVGSMGLSNVTALTGVSASSSVGALTPANSAALTGVSAAGSVGTMTAEAATGPITGSMAATDEDDVFSATEIPSCVALNPSAKNPHPAAAIAAAFLDQYGRFAKSDDTVATVRLFYLSAYCEPSFELTWVEFKALSAATRDEIRNLGSAAGLIDTEGKSNA